jgi:hypothetical protein
MPDNKLEIIIEAQNNAQKEIVKLKEEISKLTGSVSDMSKESKKSGDETEKAFFRIAAAVLSVRKVTQFLKNEFREMVSIARSTNVEVERSFLNLDNAIYKTRKRIADDLSPELQAFAKSATFALNNLASASSFLYGGASSFAMLSGGNMGANALKPKDDAESIDESFIAKTLEKEREKYRQLTALHQAWMDDKSGIDQLYVDNYLMTESIKYEQAKTMHEAFLDEKSGMEQMYIENYLMQEQYKNDQLKGQSKAMEDSRYAEYQRDADFWNFKIKLQKDSIFSLWAVADQGCTIFSTHVSKMFKDMYKGTFDAKEAFKELGFAMIDMIIDYVTKWVVSNAMLLTLGQVSKSMELAASSAFAAALTAIWAPVATLVSLATFGANSAPAMAGMQMAFANTGTLVTSGLATTGNATGQGSTSNGTTGGNSSSKKGGGILVDLASGNWAGAFKGILGLEEGGRVIYPGSVIVGESGPEILDLPTGARVTPLDKVGGSTVYFNIEINNPVMTSAEQLDEIKDALTEIVSQGLAQEIERI